MERGARYREWAVRREVAPLVVCAWAGRFADSGAPHTERVLPDGCIDLIWSGTRLMVAGPNTRAFALAPRPGAVFAGVRFRPGVAPAVLGVPASALLDRHVDAGDVLGARRAAELVGALAAAPSIMAAGRLLEAAVAGWLPVTTPADPLVPRPGRAARPGGAGAGSRVRGPGAPGARVPRTDRRFALPPGGHAARRGVSAVRLVVARRVRNVQDRAFRGG
jgi:hypothetical protein